MSGRPRLYGKHSNLFLQHYLDPLMTPADICRICDISRATFYNYEKELQLPQLRVGIENYHTHLPRKKALKLFSLPGELRELRVAREIGKRMKARLTLVPCDASDAFSALNKVQQKKVDFSIASLSWTKERSRTLYFSNPYDPTDSPHGVLIKSKESTSLVDPRAMRPTLGIYENSVHADHAFKHLQNDFALATYKNVGPLLAALRAGNLDFVLLHPVWLEIFSEEARHLEIVSQKILYKSHTGVVFHSESEQWRKPVNLAIEQMLEESSRAV